MCYAEVVKLVVASGVDDNGEDVYRRQWNADFLDLPQVKGHHNPAFTAEQVKAIVGADSPYRVLYALLAGTGMRIGEALALEVGHVSGDGLTISVQIGRASCRERV